jgi:methoxymalonate biosynthesis protein
VPAARLTDCFGDYGLIGAALVDRQPPGPAGVWLAELVMLSCRVEGRGIPAALLTWIMSEARGVRARALRAVYMVNDRNLPMRLLFRQMGFEVIGKGQEGLVLAARDLAEPPPPYPEWLEVVTPREAAS